MNRFDPLPHLLQLDLRVNRSIIAVAFLLLFPIFGFTQNFPYALPELPVGKKVQIFYNVVVNDPLDPLTTSFVGQHDTVFFASGFYLLSDDPATLMANDITLTPASQLACNSYDGVVYVDVAATGGNNNGSSWSDAFVNLQDALLARLICTENVDTILVAEGTYYPTNEDNRDSSFTIPDSVVVLGGFPSGGGSLEERDWLCHETVLDANNSYHVVVTDGVSPVTVVDGFVITGGNADGDGTNNQGGGWYNTGSVPSSNPTIRNCVFTNNSATYGGGMYNNGNSPHLVNVVFRNNNAFGGGAMYNFGFVNEASPTVVNGVFYGNVAEQGGALYNDVSSGTSSPVFTNCVFSGNQADLGGVMFNVATSGENSPSLINCIVSDNVATFGPVFFNIDGSPIVQYSLFKTDYQVLNEGCTNCVDTTGGGNKFSSDPLFVDATTGDFRLMSSSPAIDMGDNAANTEPEDLDGLSRVYNGTIDMGAYEWRPYCLQDTVYLDVTGEGIANTDNLIGELPEFTGCVIDTVVVVPSISCEDTAVVYDLFLVRDGIDTVFHCADTLWIIDTIAPVIDMVEVELMLDNECMAIMPDLSSYVSDNCGLDTVIQSPEVGEPLGLPGSIVMTTLYARDFSGNERSVSFDFEVVETAPLVLLNCVGTISPTILSDGTINLLVNEIAPNANCLPVHDVQVLNLWGGVIWSAKNLRENDHILEGFDLCDFLGNTLEVVINNGLGHCTTILNLDRTGDLTMTSALQPGLESNITNRKINVYCGQIPDQSEYVPTVTDICSDKMYIPEVQPDWVMPFPCSSSGTTGTDELSDTAEVIFRTWEAYDKEGNLFTLTDTIVVFRLPKLTPEAFVNAAEDSFYCELKPELHKGESLKRYASWKQVIGIHDYERPYTRLNGVTYEIPATIIIAGLTNASAQGSDVLKEYLSCVILKKADGNKVTIGDVVSGEYMDELISHASQEQLKYGFLQALIELNEKPLNVVLESVFNFYPYLLLQPGDWILSEGGNFEQVDEEWFYNGHLSGGASAGGNSPYWFAGGWPSIYNSGDGVRYSDVGAGKEFGCIRIQVPLLDTTGFSAELCDTICLPTGVHCGLTIQQESMTAWQGSCPQTRGLDTWITQTCWAETLNSCVEDGDYCEPNIIPAIAIRARADFAGAVKEYTCSDKAVKIRLSQWQTLYDTIGPVFDFYYPYSGESMAGVEGPTGPSGPQGVSSTFIPTDISNKSALDCFNGDEFWNHTEIREFIRAGEVYPLARQWEYCNPTTYRLDSHDCEAKVLVPSVKVVDNCSGVHSIKAIVGDRTVALELTNKEVKIDKAGDTSYVYTYSHLSNPITITPNSYQGGCDGELTEVRYEAADNCWNQSEWYKYIKIIDDVPPTVVANREVNVTLDSPTEWVKAETFDEGSWDNCGIDLKLARRSDWLNDTLNVDLCSDPGPNAPYDNWVDILDDLGIDPNHAAAAVVGEVVGAAVVNEAFNVDDLSVFLNEGEVEKYYFNQILWLWEDGQKCGQKVVHGWIFAMAAYLAENCSVADEHGNTLSVRDLESIFDNLFGEVGYGNEIALLGGGWSQAVPVTCVDACEEFTAELLVMDACCNWGTGWSTVQVEDKSITQVVKRLPDLNISCEAYNVFYKDIVETAASFGEHGSVSDTAGTFELLDLAFGTYFTASKNTTDFPDSILHFDYHNVKCVENSDEEKIADTTHDGTINWITTVTKTSDLDTILERAMQGILATACSASHTQDVWIDLDECGYGKIIRRFYITNGCNPESPQLEIEQVINLEPACEVRWSMFDVAKNIGSKTSPLCIPSLEVAHALPKELTGEVTLKPHLEGVLCSSIAVGYTDQVGQILGASGMYKIVRTWAVRDWCQDGLELKYDQEIIVQVNPDCQPVEDSTQTGETPVIGTSPGHERVIAIDNRVRKDRFVLYQNMPNPFDGYTVIGFELPEDTKARLTVYDIKGQALKVVDGEYKKGYNEVQLAQDILPVSGILYYQLDTDRYTATKRMVKVK